LKFLQDKTIASLINHSSYSSNPLVASYFCRCKDEVNPPKNGYKFTNQPLKDLGIRFTPAHEYLYEAVKSLQQKGFLPKAKASVTEVKNKVLYREFDISEHSKWYQSLHFIHSTILKIISKMRKTKH